VPLENYNAASKSIQGVVLVYPLWLK